MKKIDQPTEVLDITIQSFDPKGHGFSRYIHPSEDGPYGKHLKISVPNTVPGDKVRVTVPNAKGRARAALDGYDELLEASPDRDMTLAENSINTAGTPLLYMTYPAQLAYKENMVKGFLKEQGFDADLVQPIIGMEEPSRYRNKMELTFGPNFELGMHQPGNFRKIIDLEDSIIAPEEMIEVKHEVSKWQKDHNLAGYDKDDHTGLLRHLMMRKSFATGELMVALFAAEGSQAYEVQAEDLKNRLIAAFPQIASLMWIKNADISDRTTAEETTVLAGRDYIHDELSGFKFRIWQDTFFQPNPVQAEVMVETALDYAEVHEEQRVLDLFCGIGTFSLPFAQKAKELAGIEIVESSIASAKRNAVDNNLDNTYFVASDARKGLRELPDTWGQPDLLLLDPPRSGAGGKVMRAIGRLGTDKIIYVSCNPQSLAEDMVWLRDFGYELVKAQPIDQFPHTTHVETIALIQRETM